jgi:dipeptidyl-peptidase-4
VRTINPLLVILCIFSGFLAGDELTLEKLYSEPPMIGIPPRDMSWSPDESRCAFLWNQDSGRTKNVYCFVPDSEQNLQQWTSFKKGGISGFCWGRHSSEIIFQRGTSIFILNAKDLSTKEIIKGKKRQRGLSLSEDSSYLSYLEDGNIWIHEFERGKTFEITHFNPKQEHINRYSWSSDSKHIAFYHQDFADIRRVAIPEFGKEQIQLRNVPRPFPGDPINPRKIGIVDLASHQVKWVPHEFDNLLSFSWSPTGTMLLVEESTDYANKRTLYTFDVHSQKMEKAFEEESPVFTFSWLWSSQWVDDDHIVLTSDRSGYCHLYSLSLNDKKLKELTSGKWEVMRTYPVAGKDLFFIANKSRPENRDLYKLNLEKGGLKRIGQKNGVYRPQFSKSGKSISVLFSDDQTPFDLYCIREDELERITSSPRPEFKNFSWVKTKFFDIPGATEGSKIRAKMMFPPDFDPAEKYPAIIGSVYSNAVLNQWGGRDAHPTWGLDQYLAQVEKYVLMNLDFRGSLGYGRKFREDMLKGYGVTDIKDLAMAARYLQSQPYIETDRIGIWGSSYGGLLTLMSLFKNPGLFACGIAGAPATNVYHAFPGQMEVMKSTEDKEAYENSSAYFWSQELKAPAMIIHGMRDSVVLFMDSISLARKMIKEGKDFELVVLPDASHAWDMGPSYQTVFAFKKMVSFFARHLK